MLRHDSNLFFCSGSGARVDRAASNCRSGQSMSCKNAAAVSNQGRAKTHKGKMSSRT